MIARDVGFFSFILLSVGCGSAQTEVAEPASAATPEDSQPKQAETVDPVSEEVVEAAPGTIRRIDLDGVLADGPGAILGRVLTEPVLERGKFVGFRITAFPRGAPAGIDLRTGDVVCRVNGRSVERPENYYEIFQELKVAGELRVELLRDGTAETLLYPIVE